MTKSPSDDRLRPPPVERFSAPQQAFDLRTEIQSLKSEHPPSSKEHRQKTLYKHGKVTIALFSFNKGAELATHETAGVVTIHVIDGRLRISAGEKGERSAPPRMLASNNILILAPNVPHAVFAEEESIMLLQVHLE